MVCRLYTGATGLLGQYLLIDALRRRETVAVLIREQGKVCAGDRIDLIVKRWERRLGRLLPRPVVLQGDLRKQSLGLSTSQRNWIRQNVDSVVHCAASVRFQESRGEPLNSNVTGTQNLLELCESSQVKDFHYISTAYSCGDVPQSRIVREEPHSTERTFGNIYEKSKCLAEQLVLAAKGNFARTIYRPSVIVGDSTSGFTPNYNALYTIVRYAWMAFRNRQLTVRSVDDLLASLELPIYGATNLVPVDWVQGAIDTIVRQPTQHGKIYHLTNPVPITNREIASAILRALSIQVDPTADSVALTSDLAQRIGNLQNSIQPMGHYFGKDPTFDCTHSQSLQLPPCPPVDEDLLTRSFSYAIKSGFAVESAHLIQEEAEPRRTFERLSLGRNSYSVRRSRLDLHQRNKTLSETSDQARIDAVTESTSSFPSLRVMLTGPGGGVWKIRLRSNSSSVQYPEDGNDEVLIYGTAAAFRGWQIGRMTFEEALKCGAIVAVGRASDLQQLPLLMSQLTAQLSRPANVRKRAKQSASSTAFLLPVSSEMP